jgi:hypothetical protein
VQRELDPASEESGEQKKRRRDEHAPHEERLRIVEKQQRGSRPTERAASIEKKVVQPRC